MSDEIRKKLVDKMTENAIGHFEETKKVNKNIDFQSFIYGAACIHQQELLFESQLIEYLGLILQLCKPVIIASEPGLFERGIELMKEFEQKYQ